MTKEEIIEECKQRLGFETDYEMYSLCQHEKDFYNAIIKALEQRPSDDCVDRDHVIATISQHHFDKDKDSFDLLIHNLCKEIKELPPVTPTRKVGKWIYDSGSYKCPFCEHEITGKEDDLNYCCKCGAEMRVGE